MMSVFGDYFLLSDQNINKFLVKVRIDSQISYSMKNRRPQLKGHATFVES